MYQTTIKLVYKYSEARLRLQSCPPLDLLGLGGMQGVRLIFSNQIQVKFRKAEILIMFRFCLIATNFDGIILIFLPAQTCCIVDMIIFPYSVFSVSPWKYIIQPHRIDIVIVQIFYCPYFHFYENVLLPV